MFCQKGYKTAQQYWDQKRENRKRERMACTKHRKGMDIYEEW